MFLKNIRVCLFLLLIFSSILIPDGFPFGSNKVIVKDFNWKISSSDNFDVYFYDEGAAIVPWFSGMIEDACQTQMSGLGMESIERTPVFLYVGHNDFEQTNVTQTGEGTGGVTEAFKNRLVVPHTGSYAWLTYVTKHEFTHVLEFNVLFGGFWKSARLLKFPVYPNWLMEGLAEYETKELGATERDMYLRDAALSGSLLPVSHLHNFSYLKPHQVLLAYKESAALMAYIANEYGKEKIGHILNLFKDRFDGNTVMLETLGISLGGLDRKFREDLEEKFKIASEGMSEPQEYGVPVTKKDIYWKFDTNPVFIPGAARKIAYITDSRGYPEIRLINYDTGKTEILVGSRNFDAVESIHTAGRGLSVSADGVNLAFVGEKEQRDYIYIYDLEEKTLKRIDCGIKIINSAEISPDGKKIYFVGMQAARTAIFECPADGSGIKKLTDIYDDVSGASISPDGKTLVFSREVKTLFAERPYQRDLYTLNIESGEIKQLTDLRNDETSPVFSPDGKKVIFTADRDGVNDIYTIDATSRELKKLTGVIGGNFDPAYSHDGKYIAFSSYRKGEKKIYLAETEKISSVPVFYSKATPSEISAGGGKPFSSRPYRFKTSTDLFFPVLYYSTSEGAFINLLWQASDMLGDHSLGFSTQYVSAAAYINYQLLYNFSKFRPQFFFLFQGQGGYLDYKGNYYDVNHQQVAGFNYPLSRFETVTLAAINGVDYYTDYTVKPLAFQSTKKTHAALGRFTRNTSSGRYTLLTRGYTLNISQEAGTDYFGGDYLYSVSMLEFAKYFPLGKDHAIAWHTIGATSTGRDRYAFGIFGFNKVRMNPTYKSGDRIRPYYDTNLAVVNLEYRFPIVYDINYYMWYIFPDFFFKTFSGSLIFDAGQVWNGRGFNIGNTMYSYGAGLKFDTFILQTFYFPLNFYLTYSPINDRYEFIFSIGTAF